MLVDGKYEIGEQLGSGGMCTVYRAEHISLHREVAVKVLQDKLLKSDDAVARFQREAIAVSALKHPNIVQTFGAGMWDARPYLAMELLSGQSLYELLKKEGRLDAQRALPIFKQICDGLQHAHEQGIVHRDLKPSNVMLTADGGTKIVDFGIAKILPESGKEMQKLTQTGDLLGTLLYMSPEQLSGEPLDARSDLYSLGCMMYEVLEGTPPYTAEAPLAVINKHLSNAVPSPTNCDEKLGMIVARLMAKRPEDRIETAAELRRVLDNPASIRALSASKPPEQTKRKFPQRQALIGGTCALVVLVVAGMLWQEHSMRIGSDELSLHDIPEINKALERKDWETARKLAQLNIQLINDPKSQPREYAESLKAMANCDLNLRNYPSALEEFRQLESFAKGKHDPDHDTLMEMQAAGGVSASYWNLGRYAEAEPFADREYFLNKKFGSLDEVLAGADRVAVTKLMLGKTQEGFDAFREGFQLLKENAEIEKHPQALKLREDAERFHYLPGQPRPPGPS
jgi:serine/threonine protein kinase